MNTHKIEDVDISKGQHNHSETNLKNALIEQREGTYWELSGLRMGQQYNLSLLQISENGYLDLLSRL